uniref:Titin n=1 Tax=Schistosoma mansoni TaxID=6183 RepID=A0A5K4F5G0_SCHMA
MATVILIVKPPECPKLTAPSTPVNIKIVIIPPESSSSKPKLHITWQQPDDIPVTNFYIELKPSNSKTWQNVSADFTITELDTILPTDNLQEFVSYEFRVIAENEAGKSVPSLPSNSIELGIPLEFIRPLTNITVSSVTNEPVILECELSRTPRDKIQWFKDGKALPSRLSSRIKVEELENGKVHRIIFSPLTEEDLGYYSVKVENLTSEARVDMKSPPPSPVNVKAVVNPEKASIKDQTIELTWEQPTDQVSASGPVTNFYIELKPEDSTRWQDVSADFTITEPHFTLPTDKLQEFVSYEFRVTAENKAGKSKPSSPSNAVQLGIPLEFIRPLTNITVSSVTNEPVILECELSRTPRDKIQWFKDGKALPSRLSSRIKVEELENGKVHRIIFSPLTEEDLGYYSVKVENLTSEARVDMKSPPPSPVNVKAVVNPEKASIKDQTIELTWEQPTDQVSASGPVTNFYIELKPEDSTRWQDVSADFTITEPHFTLPTDKLQEFVSYEFRVTAENKAGKSKPSSPSNAVQLGIPLEFIRPLTNITVSSVTNEPVILECELSRTPRDKIQWFKDGKALPSRLSSRIKVEELENGKVHRIIFSPLTEEDLGYYSVKVENLTSEARVDMKIAPTLKLSESFSDKVIMKAGEAAVFEIPFVASPKPTVTWSWRPRTRPDAELGSAQTPRFKADVVSGLTSLPVSKVKREDAGEYSVVISNELGEVTVSIELIVLDKPSVPRNLVASENTGESVLFSWTEPEFLGLHPDVGVSDGLSYVVEMRESNQRASRSVTVTSELNTVIDKLQVNKSYVFSVAAKNDVGQSEFAETSPVSTKLEYAVVSSIVYLKFYGVHSTTHIIQYSNNTDMLKTGRLFGGIILCYR